MLIEVAGKDSTVEFDNAGHSEDAFEIMEEYLIGTYSGAPVRGAPKAVTLKKATPKAVAGNSFTSTALTATAAISVGAVALQAYRLNPEMLNSLPKLKTSSSGPGFLEGFLIASALFTVAGTITAKKLSKHLHFEEGGFMSYAPHKKMPKVTKVNPLIQRGWLDPTTYHALPLTEKELIAPNVYRLVFSLPTPYPCVHPFVYELLNSIFGHNSLLGIYQNPHRILSTISSRQSWHLFALHQVHLATLFSSATARKSLNKGEVFAVIHNLVVVRTR